MKKVVLFCMVMMAAFVQAQEVAETTATENSTPLYRIGQTYYYGETPLDKKAYARFLQETCPVAHNQFQQGYKTSIAGWVLFGVGLGMDVACTVTALATTTGRGRYARTSLNGSARSAVYALGVIGTALELASIPTLCVGYAKMHNSVDTFNAACYSRMKTKAYWSVNASGNGIGLAYNF
ncbi:MAG: hypothetical protein IJU36_00920 [Paludibacteraceae bacterium]|nr:hypothetical protein [Paludibacteraceae bacterium]